MLKSECILRSMCVWLYVFYSPKSGAVNGLFYSSWHKMSLQVQMPHREGRCMQVWAGKSREEVTDTRTMGLGPQEARATLRPCRAGSGQGGHHRRLGPLSPRGLLREHSEDSHPWRAGRPAAHCPPSRLCRAGASSPSGLFQRTTIQNKQPNSANILFWQLEH